MIYCHSLTAYFKFRMVVLRVAGRLVSRGSRVPSLV